MTLVTVTATDPQDVTSGTPNTRVWAFFVDTAPGAYLGGGSWANTPAVSAYAISGNTWTIDVPMTAGVAHNLYFVISQSGGSTLGSYSGTVTVSGLPSNFAGVDASTPFLLTIPPSATTVDTGLVTLALGGLAAAAGVGLMLGLRRRR